MKYDFDKIWKDLIKNAKKRTKSNEWHGAFVSYDDTPRRGKKGRIITGGSSEKFELYLKQLVSICKEQDKEFILLTAWNEWGEGGYLEPDEENQYGYLEAVRSALIENGEFPD